MPPFTIVSTGPGAGRPRPGLPGMSPGAAGAPGEGRLPWPSRWSDAAGDWPADAFGRFVAAFGPPEGAPGDLRARLAGLAPFARPGQALPAAVRFTPAAVALAPCRLPLPPAAAFHVRLHTPLGDWDLPGGPLPAMAARRPRPAASPPPPCARGPRERGWWALLNDPAALAAAVLRAGDAARPQGWWSMPAAAWQSWQIGDDGPSARPVRFHWQPRLPAPPRSPAEWQAWLADDAGALADDLWRRLDAGLTPAWDLLVEAAPSRADGVHDTGDGPGEGLPDGGRRCVGTLVLSAVADDPPAPDADEPAPRGLPGLLPCPSPRDDDGLVRLARAAVRAEAVDARDRRAEALRREIARLDSVRVRAAAVDAMAALDADLAARVARALGLSPARAAAVDTGTAGGEEPAPIDPSDRVSPGPRATVRPVAGCRVALVLADGMDTRPIGPLVTALRRAGVQVRGLAARCGPVQPAAGDPWSADDRIDAWPASHWDAVVLPPGADAFAALCADADLLALVREAWRRGRPVMALGGPGLPEAAGLPRRLADGRPDPGLLVAPHDDGPPLPADAEPLPDDGSAPGGDDLLAALAHGPQRGRAGAVDG